MNAVATNIAFSPLLPWAIVAALGAATLLLVIFGLARRARGIWWRALMLASLLLALANPSLVEEQRRTQRDMALLVVDYSASQGIGERRAQTDAALAEIQSRLERLPDLDVRTIRAGAAGPMDREGGTRLFDAVRDALADVPPGRRAGTILITDGQVHDAPEPGALPEGAPPLHALLTGAPDEADRRLALVRAPSYGIVGGEIEVVVRADDLPGTGGTAARLSIRRDGTPMRTMGVVTGREETVSVPIERAGTTILEFEVDAGPRELTLLNNRVVAVINGVRDRLRVLLVSGQPHAGERVWRNLLKSDPAVDLVHFTILRPPEKQDSTPIRELSLIAFPIRELFETKLYDFDLVVFDRYQRRGVIPQLYLGNVAKYVREGGALLEAVGPGFAEPYSTLYRTPLGTVLPSEPTGRISEGGFEPAVTQMGERHPVTAGLGPRERDAAWGRWFRHVHADVRDGDTLMTGAEDRPLLVLARVGEGRVGQLLSDHIWLWARGYEGGGPHGELLRRVAHWLMKEPDLEENALHAEVAGRQLVVERRALEPDNRPITVTAPDGKVESLGLDDAGDGRFTGSFAVDRPGLYRISDGEKTVLAAAGAPNPVEFSDVRATPARLAPAVEASGGAVAWLAEGVPDLRRVDPERSSAGRGWIGLRANRDYVVTGVSQFALLPPVAFLLLIGLALLAAWRREAT